MIEIETIAIIIAFVGFASVAIIFAWDFEGKETEK